ncbi:MAG: hypothetical protein KBT46_01270 [Ruminococcus sp.]|nr:hypothetical protein [Candidatus Copronaster equi]
MAKISEKKIKESLINQLEKKGANIDLFTDLINDYLFFCKQEKMMILDIKKKGMTYTAISAHGKEYEKENPSLKLAVAYNRQKLEILKQMGLTTEKVETDDDDESGL